MARLLTSNDRVGARPGGRLSAVSWPCTNNSATEPRFTRPHPGTESRHEVAYEHPPFWDPRRARRDRTNGHRIPRARPGQPAIPVGHSRVTTNLAPQFSHHMQPIDLVLSLIALAFLAVLSAGGVYEAVQQRKFRRKESQS